MTNFERVSFPHGVAYEGEELEVPIDEMREAILGGLAMRSSLEPGKTYTLNTGVKGIEGKLVVAPDDETAKYTQTRSLPLEMPGDQSYVVCGPIRHEGIVMVRKVHDFVLHMPTSRLLAIRLGLVTK